MDQEVVPQLEGTTLRSDIVLPPLSDTDPPKGIAEVVMIPVVAAIANGVHHAKGRRFYDYPLKPERILQALL